MNTLESVMFPVKEIPAIWVDKENGNILKKNTGHKFIVREDTNKVLSCMTNDYKVVTNEKIINYTQTIVEKRGGKFKEAEMFGDGARSVMKWHFPNEKVTVAENDNLHPEIIIKNSYDGTVGVNVQAGAFRLVCSNGMVIGIVTNDYKNKHSIYNVSLDDLEGIIESTIKNTKHLFDNELPVLMTTPIKEKHIINFIKMFPMQANSVVTQRLIVDNPKTFWDLFNVGTNVLTHHMQRDVESTHSIEGRLYPKMRTWANDEIANA